MQITIGGLPGTGKGTVGRKLAKILGYKFISGGDMFRKVAAEHNMTMGEFDAYTKTHPEARVDEQIDNFQKNLGEKEDNFIVESRLAWHFIPNAIKIRLDADENERIRRITGDKDDDRIAYRQENFEKTKQKTRARQKVHQEKITEIYDIKDMMADTHYDYIIDTTKLTPDEVVSEILKIIK